MTLERIEALLAASHKRERLMWIAGGLVYQHLSEKADLVAMRRVPRYENVAENLRRFAVDCFDIAVRQGFVDC